MLDALFPRFCLRCGKEGAYLCQDCGALLDVNEFRHCLCAIPSKPSEGTVCPKCAHLSLQGVFSALSLNDPPVRMLTRSFSQEPFVKDLAGTLVHFIVIHLDLLDKKPDFSHSVLVPLPLSKSQLKQKGYSPAEEIANVLSRRLQVPLASKALKREESEYVTGSFLAGDKEAVRGKHVYLVDVVYKTGTTMNEASSIIRSMGADSVFGITLAREVPRRRKASARRTRQ